MPKTYVLDTNVLLHNPRSIFVFENNNVVIPLAVVEEIDDQKRRMDEIGRNAREVSRLLDDLRGRGRISSGISLPGGGSLRIEINQRHVDDLGPGLDVVDLEKPDNRILAVALNLSRDERHQPVVLVSKDLNLRVKADVLGVRAEDLQNDEVEFDHLYSGQTEMSLPQEEVDAFYRDKAMEPPVGIPMFPNQFAVLTSSQSGSSSALARRVNGRLGPLGARSQGDCFGLKARNKEQLFALDLLMDQSVKIVTLAGEAGTGKTLLALAAGLEQVVEQGRYNKLLVTRPVVPLHGQELGFLPGDKQEKIRPWMQPIYDNLEFLFHLARSDDEPPRRGKNPHHSHDRRSMGIAEYLTFTGQMEIEALTYIRGRSIPRRFIIVDEAQNCTAHAVKTLLTRVGEGSKIVFTGDVEQIDHPYLDSASNGLTRLVEKIKGSEVSGHVTLLKGERSEVAELGAGLW